MNLRSPRADTFIPNGRDLPQALARTTHLGIGAHPDDLEILAIDGILECAHSELQWFTGVTVTDGAGTPRTGDYAQRSNEELRAIRLEEQRNAASISGYACQVSLGYASADVKAASHDDVVADLATVLDAAQPHTVYTHNPFDKHDTHVAVMLRAIEALRRLDADARPKRVFGVEVWRDLDWLPDDRKVVFDCSQHEQLQRDLINAFESQVKGAKRYDRAVMGRRAANATYLDPHAPDSMTYAVYAVDMTPLIGEEAPHPAEWASKCCDRFAADVSHRLKRF